MADLVPMPESNKNAMKTKLLEQTMRWYGPKDPVKLQDIRQAGASGVVTALHHLENGTVWTKEEILKRKTEIENAGLKWSVVESLAVHEDIKTRTGAFKSYISNYKTSIQNLAQCGIKTVCYNFMPLLDWTRTKLDHVLPNGSKALLFEKLAVIAFDLFILERERAIDDYTSLERQKAETFFKKLTKDEKETLKANILKGLPGSEVGFTMEEFRQAITNYQNMSREQLSNNLNLFLAEVVPVAETNGLLLCIHPDDPPFPLFGLPRVVSTAEDVRRIFRGTDSLANGLTFCSGSFGVRADNDLPAMVQEFGKRIHFIHLRATKRDDNGNFYEADHLDGDVPMYELMRELLVWQQKKENPIPMRPDHGHQMMDDLNKVTYPGYTGIGRMKGLAELRGLELGIAKALENKNSF